jgi:hypothetical protein
MEVADPPLGANSFFSMFLWLIVSDKRRDGFDSRETLRAVVAVLATANPKISWEWLDDSLLDTLPGG